MITPIAVLVASIIVFACPFAISFGIQYARNFLNYKFNMLTMEEKNEVLEAAERVKMDLIRGKEVSEQSVKINGVEFDLYPVEYSEHNSSEYVDDNTLNALEEKAAGTINDICHILDIHPASALELSTSHFLDWIIGQTEGRVRPIFNEFGTQVTGFFVYNLDKPISEEDFIDVMSKATSNGIDKPLSN